MVKLQKKKASKPKMYKYLINNLNLKSILFSLFVPLDEYKTGTIYTDNNDCITVGIITETEVRAVKFATSLTVKLLSINHLKLESRNQPKAAQITIGAEKTQTFLQSNLISKL